MARLVLVAPALAVAAISNASSQTVLPGWIVGSRPDCRVWNAEPRPGESIVWTGACANGYAQGHGTLIWLQNEQNTDRFSGEYQNGKRTGRGTYIWANGERYEGSYQDDRRTGSGIYSWPNGDRYQGSFRDGHFYGRGTMTWFDGSRFEGNWQDSRAHGFGTKSEPDGSVYQGLWVRGCFRASDRVIAVGATVNECENR